MKINKKGILNSFICISVCIFMFSIIKHNNNIAKNNTLSTNASAQLSNKKICWGIKREPNHKQPDVGAANKRLLEQYNGICLGNENSKKG